MKLSKNEKEELLDLAKSDSLRNDMKYLSANRFNPILVNGIVNMDRVIEFLTQYNEFNSHQMRPFRKIIDKDMRL